MSRNITAFPLTWPDGWKRETIRRRARFDDHSMTRAVRECLAELLRLGVPDWSVVISSNVEVRLDGTPRANQRTPADPGVAVWFSIGGNLRSIEDVERERRVLACDRWDRPEHNLWAIAQHIAAIRAQERWGVGSLEQAFRGYAALPAPESGWRSVLGECRTVEDVNAAYRARARAAHPDTGGSSEAFAALGRARDAALAEFAPVGPATRRTDA